MPLVEHKTSVAGRTAEAAAGIGCRVVFADFSSRSPEKSFAKIAALSIFNHCVKRLIKLMETHNDPTIAVTKGVQEA